MTNPEEFRLIKRYTPLVLACMLVGVLVAAVIVWRTPKTYESNADVFVAAVSNSSAGGVYDRARFAQERIKSYVPLATSSDVMQTAIAVLGLHTTPAQLSRSVTAQAVPGTVLLHIGARAHSSLGAQRLATAVANSLVSFVTDLEGTVGGSPYVKLRVVRPADPKNTPVAPRTYVDLLVGALLGLGVGLGAARLRHRWTSDSLTVPEQRDASSHPAKAVRISRREALRSAAGKP